MKTIIKPLALVFTGCMALTLMNCESKRSVEDNNVVTVDTEDQDTATVIRSGETTEDKVEELRAWMNRKADKADTSIRANWPETRERIRDINADIEQNFDSLSTETKAEYQELKKGYAEWEQEQERRQMQPLKPQEIANWKTQLLGEYSNLEAITPQTIREAYLTFMGSVRTKQRSYSQGDWDYVDHVYSDLNQRRREVEGQMSTGDKLKIRALQAEYLALEGAADTRSMVRGVDN